MYVTVTWALAATLTQYITKLKTGWLLQGGIWPEYDREPQSNIDMIIGEFWNKCDCILNSNTIIAMENQTLADAV
jgi:hypothetical protein